MLKKTVGILGGMGPEATVDFMHRIIKAVPAGDDRDHIRMIVDNNPQVPSRIEALIEGSGESPAPCLREMARKLEAWGADFLAMPCNTAHYYHREVQEAVRIPLLSMIQLAVDEIALKFPGLEKVGLLASTAVHRLGLYTKPFADRGIEVAAPGDSHQEGVLGAIRKIKSGCFGRAEMEALQAATKELADRGAGALLVACTELSVVDRKLAVGLARLDSAQILAEAVVRKAKGKTDSTV